MHLPIYLDLYRLSFPELIVFNSLFIFKWLLGNLNHLGFFLNKQLDTY